MAAVQTRGYRKLYLSERRAILDPFANQYSITVYGSTESDYAKSKPTTPKAPTPDVKHAQSKIGSMKNATHTPGGGNVKIASQKKDYSTVQGKIGSKVNLEHRAKGGEKKILSQKLEWKAESRVGSLHNAKHSPGGGNVKVCTIYILKFMQ